MSYRIKNHRLADAAGKAVEFKQTPNKSGVITPTVIVLHDTAGRLDASGSVSWLCDKAAKASAHFVVGREGEVVQLCATNVATWHAGASSYKGRSNVNGFSVGIEIVNPGKMTGAGSSARAWYGSTFEMAKHGIQRVQTPEHGDGWWMPYTDKQIQAVLDICLALKAAYPIADVTTHYAISPGRKVDVNPLFPVANVRNRVLGRGPVEDQAAGGVTAKTIASVNQRRWPSYADNVIQVIPRGASVEVVKVGTFMNGSETASWSLVRAGDHEGWVHGGYLDAA